MCELTQVIEQDKGELPTFAF